MNNFTSGNLIIGSVHTAGGSFVNVVATRGAFLIHCRKKYEAARINSVRKTISGRFVNGFCDPDTKCSRVYVLRVIVSTYHKTFEQRLYLSLNTITLILLHGL